MKQTKLLTTALWLFLWLPQIVLGQQNSSFLKMKPGDWFEMKVNADELPQSKELYAGKLPFSKALYEYLIRYQLKKTEPNGNKIYQLTFERIKMKILYQGAPLGYDTYYPPFRQGGKQILDKPVFLLEVDKTGKTGGIKSQTNIPKIELNEIAFRKSYGGTSMGMDLMQVEIARAISDAITKSIATGNTTFNGQVIKDSDLSVLITGASFSLQKNTLITGKISNVTDSIKRKISLYLEGYDIDIRIAKDGSFNVPIFLTASADVNCLKDTILYAPTSRT